MRDINLLPSLSTDKNKSLKDGRLYILIAIVLLIPLLAFSYQIFILKPEIVTNNNETIQLSEKILQYTEVNKVKEEKASLETHKLSLENILTSIDKRQNMHTQIIKDLTKLMPENVFAANYSLNEDIININCRALTEESIAYFLRNVKESGFYTNVAFNGVTTNLTAENSVQDYSFALQLTLNKQ